MAYTAAELFKFNGVLDTAKPVLSNIETMCNAVGSWFSFDNHSGKWSIIINRAGPSVASFNDTNILGSLVVSSTGLTELYNSVRVSFPHVDLNDTPNYIDISLPLADRNPQEPPNELQMEYDIFNDPVQAQYLAMVELKQNRLDTVVHFTTDFSQLGLKAGDIIDITTEMYDWTAKKFRIINLSEVDEDDGRISIDIYALEYNDSVYDTSDLERTFIPYGTGIQSFGVIGIPSAPIVTTNEIDSRPSLTVSTVCPGGVIDRMEFWWSPTGAADSYQLYAIQTPPVGTTFVFGNTITHISSGLDISGLTNIYIKCRAGNAQTTGPFGNATLFSFEPVVTADAIGPDTAAIDNLGNNLLTEVGAGGASLLLSSVDKLYSTDANVFTGNTSLWSNVVGGFTTQDPNAYPQIITSQYAVTGYLGNDQKPTDWATYYVPQNIISDTLTHVYTDIHNPVLAMPFAGSPIIFYTFQLLGTFSVSAITTYTVGIQYNTGSGWNNLLSGWLSATVQSLPPALTGYSYGSLPEGALMRGYVSVQSDNWNYGYTYGFRFYAHTYMARPFTPV